MSYGYSAQSMEIYAGADIGDDPAKFSELVWELTVFLQCTDSGHPGNTYGPPENCFQGWDPEFEVESYKLTGEAEIVIYDGKDHKIIAAIIGSEVLDKAIEKAIESALEEPLD